MILVVTSPEDRTAGRVVDKLHERHADVQRFNPADYPSKSSISLGLDDAGRSFATLRTAQGCIDLRRLDALWIRRPDAPVPHGEIRDKAAQRYLADECVQHLQDVWSSLDCLCVPAVPPVLAHAELKVSQLEAAAALGLELPPTLVSNDPDEFLGFYRRHGGHIVSKLPGTTFNRHFGDKLSRYTEIVSPRDVGYGACIRFGPVIFQAYVPKRLELRITVVGQRVFAAEIHSQANRRTRHDWRRYDLANTPHRVHALPGHIEQACVRLVEWLGLCYGAIDMVLTPDGRYVFLEINPNGQFLWIEDMTQLPISDAIADLLMSAVSPRHAAAPRHESLVGATA